MGRSVIAAGTLLGLSAFHLSACAHEVYRPAPARVEAPPGSLSFDDCELGDGSSVPADFPKGSLAPAGAPERALACGLSSQLVALGEPALFPLPQTTEVVRLLWIRSGAHPVSVRFERQDTTGQLRGAQTSGKGLAPPGDPLEESSATATAEQVRDLVARIEAAHLWTPSAPPAALPRIDSGSLWLFEGARAGEYRVRILQRDTLARDPAFNALARTLVGMSGLHIQGAVY